jgi:Holliday junction resolvasome RuvABC endonuclease subunit
VIIYGIDPGIAFCGFAAIDEDAQLLDVAVVTTKKGKRTGDAQERVKEVLDEIAGHMLTQVSRFDEIAVIEWPVVGGRGPGQVMANRSSSTALTFAVAGALLGSIGSRVLVLHTPPPQSWRHKLMGCRASGDVVQRHVDRTYRITERLGKTRAPHALDAVGLALYGLKLHMADRAERRAA